jgi:type IV secretion system protein VirD4
MSKGMKNGLYPWRSQLIGAALLAAAYLGAGFAPWWVTAIEVTLGLVLLVGRTIYWIKRGRFGAKAHVARFERKQERSEGAMSRWDHMKNFSKTAMRVRHARLLQPGREELEGFTGWLRIFWEPVTAYAWNPGHSNYGQKWMPLNSHITRVSAARSGKSQGLMHRIINHVGPVVATSTRSEVYTDTAMIRADMGPIYLFNAGQVGNHVSNLKWSVLSGCRDMNTAQRRARDLVGPLIPGTDRANWDGKAIDVLGPMMYLAAHKGLNMRAVRKLFSTAESDIKRVWGQIQTWLDEVPHGQYARGGLELFFSTNDRTRTSITSSLGPALAWLDNEATAVLGDSIGVEFDVEYQLLDTNATLYMLGGKDRGVEPLMRALIAEIVYQSAKAAERQPGGRLSPTLLMALDELPLTCPGPVDKWVLDMGGRGVVMDLVVQQRAGLDEIWGVNGRDIILGNCLAVLFGAGCNTRAVAEDFAVMSGTRTELRNSYDADNKLTGSSEVEVTVLDPGKLMALETGESVFFTRGRIDVIKTKRAEKMSRVKRAKARFRSALPGQLDAESQQAQDDFEREYVG